MESNDSKGGRAGGCLVRLFWMAVGNLILVFSAIGIGQRSGGFALAPLDAVFWAAAFSMPALRYVDIRYWEGETADNRPATMADWRRYSALVLAVSLLLWLGAHLWSLQV